MKNLVILNISHPQYKNIIYYFFIQWIGFILLICGYFLLVSPEILIRKNYKVNNLYTIIFITLIL